MEGTKVLAIKILLKTLAYYSLHLISSRLTHFKKKKRPAGAPCEGFLSESDVAVETCFQSGGLGLWTPDIILSNYDLWSAGGSRWVAAHSSSLFFFWIPQQFEAAYSLPDKETHFSHNLHLKEEPHISKTTVLSALRPRFRLIYVLLWHCFVVGDSVVHYAAAKSSFQGWAGGGRGPAKAWLE